ncbi:NAD(P)-dependent alcohol dehydrogenase [Streptomyces sp. NPDC002328]|uniref:NAD(P)-dependent alcohol dehydrogenase n=1 Tax=Streptomyces sp. NPDC002328 TaxID=3364642 RepID=UPI0036B2B2A9
MLTVNAYGATSATDPLVPMTVDRREVGPHDVLIEIKYTGICHSDIHHARSDWREETYPLVPGHEIAGVVKEVGSDVTRYAVGDRVGVGCMIDSCRECVNCRKDQEQYCLKGNTLTYGSLGEDGRLTQGGYATHIVVTEDFVLRIPDGIGLDAAAPLLCAGITTYAPLRRWGAGPGKKVAVVGLGGLGHMAVKLAHAMGAEVTVLSQSLKKMDDGLRLGADHYHATSDPATFEQLAGTFDVIVNTVSARIDLDAYLALLATDGIMANVGAPAEPVSLNVFALLGGQRALAGSLIGGIRETQEMLDFCAEHRIGSEIEVIPAEKINEAYERVLASDVRYRFVIDIATLS